MVKKLIIAGVLVSMVSMNVQALQDDQGQRQQGQEGQVEGQKGEDAKTPSWTWSDIGSEAGKCIGAIIYGTVAGNMLQCIHADKVAQEATALTGSTVSAITGHNTVNKVGSIVLGNGVLLAGAYALQNPEEVKDLYNNKTPKNGILGTTKKFIKNYRHWILTGLVTLASLFGSDSK